MPSQQPDRPSGGDVLLHAVVDAALDFVATDKALALGLLGTPLPDIRAVLELDPQLPPVLVSGVQTRELLLNLGRNAPEAMGEMEPRELRVATRSAADEVEITVADTGPGIAAEIADRLFQPLAATKQTGMGLGLSISRELIESHDGRLGVAPRAAGGTVFRITPPILADQMRSDDG